MLAIKNFATCFIASAVTVAATSIDVDDASRLPTLQQGDYFYLTLQSFTSRGYVEIVRVTGVSGNTLTVVRGQESTSAKAFSAGDYAEQRFTKATFADFVAQSVAGKADLTGALFTGDVQVATQGQADGSVVRYDTLVTALGARVSQSDFDNFAATVNTEFDGVASSIDSLGQNKADLSALNSGLALKVDKSAVEATGNLIMRQGGPRDIQIAQALANTTGGAYVSVDAPPNPFLGMRWFCMLDGRTYIWIIDSNSSQWVEENPQSPDWITTSAVLSDLATNKNLPADITIGGKKPDNGDPVLSAKWIQKRSAMWTGFAAGDGQELSRALYPDAWAAINAGLVPVCTKAEWIADPAKRGCFHTGDGSTTFGLPDYNGVQPGSYGPVYLGGGTTDGGTILRDRIQNIVGKVNISAAGRFEVGTEGYTGPFAANSTATVLQDATGRTTASQTAGINFDASRVARTGDTTRPITAEGCIAIKLFGAVQNTGSADAAALATAVAALAARVTALEAKEVTSSGTTGTVTIEKLGTKKLVSFVVTLAAGSANQVFTIPVGFTSIPVCIGASNTVGSGVYGATGVVALTNNQITLQNPSSASASTQCRITLLGE